MSEVVVAVERPEGLLVAFGIVDVCAVVFVRSVVRC